MKLKIKVKRINKKLPLPEILAKGEWVDLRSSDTVVFKAPQAGVLKKRVIQGEVTPIRDVIFDTKLIRLGIAMELPKGFEAIVNPRSSLPKLKVFQTNSQAVIDNSFNGNSDEWKYWVTALAFTEIKEGDRICQFRIQLSQKATFWQKLKWFFSSGIKLIETDNLSNPDRDGIGSTGLK